MQCRHRRNHSLFLRAPSRNVPIECYLRDLLCTTAVLAALCAPVRVGADPVFEGGVYALSAEEQVYEAAMLEAEIAYSKCLSGGLASACARERDTFRRYLPIDVADIVLGCREERVLDPVRGRGGANCQAYDARFRTSDLTVTATEGL